MSSKTHKKTDPGSVVTATDVRSGNPVFWSQPFGWLADVAGATVYRDADVASRVVVENADEAIVIDGYLIGTDEQGTPLHIRESIRAAGPTVKAAA